MNAEVERCRRVALALLRLALPLLARAGEKEVAARLDLVIAALGERQAGPGIDQ